MRTIEHALARMDCSVGTVNSSQSTSDTTTIAVNFSRLPLEKLANLSTAGNRERDEDADWMLVLVRLLEPLLWRGVGVNICTAIRQSQKRFVVELDIAPKDVELAKRRVQEYLAGFDVNCEIFS